MPLLAGVLLLFSMVAAAAATPWRGRETVESGVTVVKNPAAAMEKPLDLTLEEQWRIGGESENEGEFFGLITDIAVHPSGDVYLVDMQLSEVKVFSRKGKYLRTIGREGEGPAEFRRPSTLFIDPDGNIGVVQMQPSRVVMLKPDGTPAAPFALKNTEDGGFRTLQDAAYRGGSLVIQGANFRPRQGAMDRTSALVRLDRQGNEVARFHEMTSTSNMARLVIKEEEFGFPWAVGPQGDVFAALDRTWKLQMWAPDGKLQRVIELEYEPLMRTAAEIEKRKKEMSGRIQIRTGAGRIEPEFDISDRERDIRWFAVADDGHLWVLSSRGIRDLPPGTIGHFDVFDPQGRYLQRVTLKGEADFEEDRLVLSGDRLFVIRQFAAAARAMTGREGAAEAGEAAEAVPMSVLCYALRWAPPRGVAASAP